MALQKILVYPKTKADKVIVTTDSENGTTKKLTDVLEDLGSFASDERWGNQTHIELAGLSSDLDIEGKTPLEILQNILCPVYAPYWKNRETTVTWKTASGNTIGENETAIVQQFNSGNNVSTPYTSYIRVSVVPRSVVCYNNDYTTKEVSIYTFNDSIGPAPGHTDTTSVSKGITTRTITKVAIRLTNSRSGITASNGTPTTRIANKAKTLLSNNVTDESSLIQNGKLKYDGYSQYRYLGGAGTFKVKYYPPAIFYKTSASANTWSYMGRATENGTENTAMWKGDVYAKIYRMEQNPSIICYYVREDTNVTRYVKSPLGSFTIECTDDSLNSSASTYGNIVEMYGEQDSNGVWSLVSGEGHDEEWKNAHPKYTLHTENTVMSDQFMTVLFKISLLN